MSDKLSTAWLCRHSSDGYAWGGFPFPINECIFMSAESLGIRAGTPGNIPVVHLPTRNVWILSSAGEELALTPCVNYLSASADQKNVIISAIQYHQALKPSKSSLPIQP